jgi:endonuclease YncB( thermonuclease family)
MARLALLLAVMLAAPAVAAPRVIEGPANVLADGSIRIHGDVIRLFGIWLPRSQRTCSTLLDPTFCAPAAVVVLFEQVRGFLRCQVVQELPDGTLEAYCGKRGRRLFDPHEDLGALLIEDGFALVRPDAPAEYRALERLAESQERGFWGNKLLRVR